MRRVARSVRVWKRGSGCSSWNRNWKCTALSFSNNNNYSSSRISVTPKGYYDTIHQRTVGCYSTSSFFEPPDSTPLKQKKTTESKRPEPIEAEKVPEDSTPSSDDIFEVTEANFKERVINQSDTHGIILDCYADWCGPCKKLTPILEKEIAKSGQGFVKLAKVNTDKNPNLAAQLSVQSIPFVLAIHKAQVTDHFLGLKTASEVSTFIKKLRETVRDRQTTDSDTEAPQPKTEREKLQSILQAANESLASGELELANIKFKTVLEATDYFLYPYAIAGLARVALADGKVDVAEELVQALQKDYKDSLKKIEVQQAISAVELAVEAKKSGLGTKKESENKLEELRKKVNDNGEDLETRYELAKGLFLVGEHEKALDEALELMRRNRKWNEEAARKLILKIFDALGSTSDVVKKYKPKFASVWFC